MRRMTRTGLAILVCVGLMATMGCTGAQKGAGIGTLGGAAAGALIGHQSGNTGAGAAIGAGAGLLGGYIVGNEMDKNKTQGEIDAARTNAAAAHAAANTVTINVTNSNGSITPVVLRRQGNVYIGPKGEQYTTLPTAAQLKPVYGF